MNRLNGRGDWDDYDERIIIRIPGMVRLSKEIWVTKAIKDPECYSGWGLNP